MTKTKQTSPLIAAIETKYRGYEFRSRLEAKYAAFFDLCGWRWSYEPIDLDGWIPDFAIGERPMLVEVKPFFHIEDWSEAVAKARSAGWQNDIVLLGADPTWLAAEDFCDAPEFGFIAYRSDEGEDKPDNIWPLNFGFTEGNGKLGLCSMEGAWFNMLWKAPENISHPNKWARVELRKHQIEEQLIARWANATNIARWMPLKGAR